MINKPMIFACMLSIIAVAAVGCGDSTVSTLSGKLTAGGNAPKADAISLVLDPTDGSKGTVLNVAADGTYSGEAKIGPNKAHLVVYGDLAASGIAEKYTDAEASTLTVDIAAGGTQKDFEVGE